MDILNLVIKPDAPADVTLYRRAMDILLPLMPILCLITLIAFVYMLVRLFSKNKKTAIKPLIISLIAGALAFGCLYGYIYSYIEISRAYSPKIVEFDQLELERDKTYSVADLADYYQTTLDKLSITGITFNNSTVEPSYEISEDEKSITIYEGNGDVSIYVYCYSPESYHFTINGTIA